MSSIIHCAIEVRKNGKWECLEEVDENPYPLFFMNCDEEFINPVFGDVDNENGKYRIKPLSSQRGLPNDVSDEFRKYGYRFDAFFDSFVTLREILDYDWEAKVLDYGLVSPEEAAIMDAYPDYVPKHCHETENRSYIRREWKVPIKLCFKGLLREIPRLYQFGIDNVRFVFFFEEDY